MTKKQFGQYRKGLVTLGQWLIGVSLAILLGLAEASMGAARSNPVDAIVIAPAAPPQATAPASKAASADPTTPDAAQIMQQGREDYQAKRFAEAATTWQAAVKTYEGQGDRLNQALALSYLALAYQELGQVPEAKAAIANALNLVQQSNLKTQPAQKILAQVLNSQGSLQLSEGQAAQALETWKQAAIAYTQAGDQAGAVGSLVNQAQAQQALGFYLQARKTLTTAAETLQKQTDPAIKATGLHSLGDVLRLVGDFKTSQQVLEQSLSAAQQAGLDEGEILLSLGNTARAKQELTAALQFYRQAARSASSTTRTQSELNQFSLLVERKQWAEAQMLQSSLRSAVADLPLSRSSIYAQINFAQSLAQLRQASATAPAWLEIAKLAAGAVQQAKTLGDPQAEAYALGNLGALYEKSQQWGEAQSLTQKALVLAQSINAPDIAYQWQWQLGRLLNAQGDREGAIAAYTEAVAILKGLRSDLVATSADVQFSFRESVEPVYRQLVGLLLADETNTSQENLRKARNVIESLQLAQLDNFFQEACLNARPAQIDRVDREAAVLYSIMLEDRLEVVLALPNQPLRHYATRLSQKEIEGLIDKMWRSLRRTSPSTERLPVAQRLYDMLIRPAEAELAASGVKTLVFVLDGPLQTLPMAALYDGKQFLIDQYSIGLTPGLQLLEPQPLVRQQLKLLVGGLSQASQGFAPLPGVESEIQQITSKVPAEVLLNQGFTSSTLQTQIASTPFPVVHLATHGQFSSSAKETFVLAWDSPINVKQLDDLLRGRELRDRNPIELLVLSACQTAVGDRRATLGLAGMAVRSGARSTLATLWAVDDQSTAALMVKFYQNLTQSGLTKAEALRRAQLELRNQPGFRHPYYWAPFVLVGNWL